MFLAIIGAEAGYMGLRALATGGVYLCGGITPKARSAQHGGPRTWVTVISVRQMPWPSLARDKLHGPAGAGHQRFVSAVALRPRRTTRPGSAMGASEDCC